jgi:hypothetical protein
LITIGCHRLVTLASITMLYKERHPFDLKKKNE